MDPTDVVRRLGGTATHAQLAGQVTRAALRRSLSDGRLRRLSRGVYGLPDLPAPLAAAAAVRGVVSHQSAALLHGLDVPTAPSAVHVTVPPGARPVVPSGVELHWSRLAGVEVADGVTGVLRTVLDCAVLLPFAEAVAVADSALRERLLVKSDLVVAAYAQPPRRRRRCTAVADAADARSENLFESLTRALLVGHGIRGLHTQVPVLLAGFVVHVDLADEARRIAVEAEGFEYHRDKAAFARDCERYTELAAADWRVLRFTWNQVLLRPEWVVDVVRRTQRSRPPQVRRWSATPWPVTGGSAGDDEAVARAGAPAATDSLEP